MEKPKCPICGDDFDDASPCFKPLFDDPLFRQRYEHLAWLAEWQAVASLLEATINTMSYPIGALTWRN
jgi:hypothetical protein